MKWVWRSLGLLAGLALGLWLWSVFFPSPEKVIRKELLAIARCASTRANEGLLARASKSSELVGYFSADASVILDAPGLGSQTLNGLEEITQAAKGLHAGGALKVEFLDASVKLSADKESATVDLTAMAKTPGDQDFFVQEMKFVFKKIDGKWLIFSVETVKPISTNILPTVFRSAC